MKSIPTMANPNFKTGFFNSLKSPTLEKFSMKKSTETTDNADIVTLLNRNNPILVRHDSRHCLMEEARLGKCISMISSIMKNMKRIPVVISPVDNIGHDITFSIKKLNEAKLTFIMYPKTMDIKKILLYDYSYLFSCCFLDKVPKKLFNTLKQQIK